MATRSRHRLECLVILAYVVCALVYGSVVPLWEAPDEPQHYGYVADLVSSGFTLPRQLMGAPSEAHQPPLHYALAAAITAPFDVLSSVGRPVPNPRFSHLDQGTDPNLASHGTAETFPYQGYSLAFHVARLISLLEGAATVLLTMRIAALLFPTHTALVVLAGALAGLNPQFLFISAVLNNDGAVTMASTGVMLQALLALKRPDAHARWWRLGLWAGLAILAKMTGAAAVLAAGAVVALALLTGQQRWPGTARRLGMVATAAVAVCGWWFVRNQILYGDPLGAGVYRQVFWATQRHAPLAWADVSTMLATQLRTYWGEFGWLTVPAPAWFHTTVRVVLVVSAVCLLSALLRGALARLSSFRFWGVCLLVSAIVAQEGLQLALMTQSDPSVYQGRYLFPVVAPLSILTALGLYEFAGRSPRLVAPVVAWLPCVALFLALTVVAPAYASVPLQRWAILTVPHNGGADLGDRFMLLGHQLHQRTAPDRLEVTLYWQATRPPDFDYSAFVHLVDGEGTIVAQSDHGPGADRDYLPTRWLAGDVVKDEHIVVLPTGLEQGPYRLHLGLYNWETGIRLPVRQSATSEPEAAVAVAVVIDGQPSVE